MVEFKWRGKQIEWRVRNAVGDALDDLGRRLVWRVRRALNIPYPPASEPGHPPHRRTGLLRNSIFTTVNRHQLVLHLRVDEEAFYWKFLERGTIKMAPRPFLGITLDAMQTTISTEIRRLIKRYYKMGGSSSSTKGGARAKKGGKSKSRKASRKPGSSKDTKKLKRSSKKKPKLNAAAKRNKRLTDKFKKTQREQNRSLLRRAKKAAKKLVKKFKRKFSKPKIDPLSLTGNALTRYILKQARKFQ